MRKILCVIGWFCLIIGWHRLAAQPSGRPNIVFVIVDSHRADALGVSGHPIVKTPNMDQLAAGGLHFRQTYVTTAICVVSRASILSGQYQQRHQINDFGADFSDEAWAKTYPMRLKQAGYSIAQIGFLGVGKKPRAESFDHWEASVPWMTEDGEHQTDGITRRATDYIKSRQGSSQPFYLAVSYTAAHEIDPRDGVPAHYQVQARYKDLYKEKEMPVPVSAAPEHWESFPAFFKTDQNIGRARWKGFFSDDSLLRENTRNYYRLITGLDEAVGKITQAIRQHAPNTVIIYTSDHGFSLGEHGLMGKWFGFDEGLRVPLIVTDLRENPVLKRAVSDELALNIDLAPTILGLAGIGAPADMQGIDLIKTLGKKEGRRDHFFYEHTVFPSPLLPKMEGVVAKDLKYMLFTEHGYELLYDRKKDRYETLNLVSDLKYRKQLARFRKLYAAYKESLP